MTTTPPIDNTAAAPGQSWHALRITVPAAQSDAVTALLWTLPISGVEERATAEVPGSPVQLIAGVEPREGAAAEAGLREALTTLWQAQGLSEPFLLEREAQALAPEPSAEGWRETLSTLVVSPRLVVVPSWLKHTRIGQEQVVRIDPGDAFGDGRHETTRACLRAIDGLMAGIPGTLTRLKRPVTVLDVGTGTGVLLLAALKLGAQSGLGLEIDEQAAATALENRDRNRMQRRARISLAPLEEEASQYSLVIANILTQRLIALKSALTARVKPGGTLLLSGIVWEQADEVAQAFAPAGFQCRARFEEGGWVALVLQAGESARTPA